MTKAILVSPIDMPSSKVACEKISESLKGASIASSIYSVKINEVLEKFGRGDLQSALEEMAGDLAKSKDSVVLIPGINSSENPMSEDINRAIAQAVDASVVFTSKCNGKNCMDIASKISAASSFYKVYGESRVLGVSIGGEIVCDGALKEYNLVNLGAPSSFDSSVVKKLLETETEARISPALFSDNLLTMSAANPKRIVLPEGTEPRTIQAAVICAEKGLADVVLIGEKAKILSVMGEFDLSEPKNHFEIIEPQTVIEKYVAPMAKLREKKGLTEDGAREQLQDEVVLGTMMLAEGDVDGLVSGAVHTTADTIRPALQLVKTAPGSSIVSSVFFMGLPDQVLVFGDCAVNPQPSAEQLADIAIQSTETAKSFGLPARTAMISYSTGASGAGADVLKVDEATKIAQEKRSDLDIEGPLQYDAAIHPAVGASKAPDSKVAGKATVFVFPDLDTGNCTYKAVQRNAGVIAMGPMLQGMAKPVNDLSRGALIEDIVFTIVLTVIQAQRS